MAYFSIIIPVYNVEPYLRECLDSVRFQTFSDWEAVCVDDGSQDGSGSILDEYSAVDCRFKVCRQMNMGVSAARNKALDMANGDWILFLDGDDVIAPWACEEIQKYLNQTECDAVISMPAEKILVGDSDVKEFLSASLTRFSELERASSRQFIRSRFFRGCICGAILKRQVFGDVRLPVGIPMMEDFCYRLRCLQKPSCWIVVGGTYYGYRQRRESASHLDSPEKNIGALRAIASISVDLREALHDDKDVAQFLNVRKGAYVSFLRRAIASWGYYSEEERSELQELSSEIQTAMKGGFLNFFDRTRMFLLVKFTWGRWALPLVMMLEHCYNLASRTIFHYIGLRRKLNADA